MTDKIISINLVASCGFSIELEDNALELEIITIGDLSTQSIKELKEHLKNELGNDSIPTNLKFIIPQINIKDQQDYTIAKIANLVDELFPHYHCNPNNIYRVLIDELHRKGIVTYDYNNWNDLLNRKALTSEKVKSTIKTHTSLPQNAQLQEDIHHISNEIGLSFIEKKALRKKIERIHIERIGFPSSLSIFIKNAIIIELKHHGFSINSDIKQIIKNVETTLNKSIKDKIGSAFDIKAAIIYEVIMSDL